MSRKYKFCRVLPSLILPWYVTLIFYFILWFFLPLFKMSTYSNLSPFLEIAVNETYFFLLTVDPVDHYIISSFFLHTRVCVCGWLIVIRKTGVLVRWLSLDWWLYIMAISPHTHLPTVFYFRLLSNGSLLWTFLKLANNLFFALLAIPLNTEFELLSLYSQFVLIPIRQVSTYLCSWSVFLFLHPFF